MNELLAPIYWVFAHDVDGAFQRAQHFATECINSNTELTEPHIAFPLSY